MLNLFKDNDDKTCSWHRRHEQSFHEKKSNRPTWTWERETLKDLESHEIKS